MFSCIKTELGERCDGRQDLTLYKRNLETSDFHSKYIANAVQKDQAPPETRHALSLNLRLPMLLGYLPLAVN